MDRDQQTDAELVKQFQNTATGKSGRKAFSTLYQRHETQLRWYLLRLTGSPKLADDLTQETFLKALEGLGDFKQNSSFETWLFRIATNTWKDYLKKKRPVNMEVDEERRNAEVNAPDAVVAQNEKQERLLDAIDRLPETVRSAIVLVRMEGMKYREAADVLEISMSALKSRISRAYRLLKNDLSSSINDANES